jgi:CDP-4-dehydro-6-deoxyglucose reductase
VGFRVRLQESGQAFEVAAGETVLEAARRAGVKLAHECTLGNCGTCRVKLVEGTVGYQDWPAALSPEEAARGYALACQALPRRDLVVSTQRVPLAEPERHTALITGIEPFCDSVTHLALVLPDREAFDFRPGQHMNVHLGDGSHRSFSMASMADGNGADFHVRRIPGGRFTDRILGGLQPGDTLEVELPLGTFRLHEEDYRELVFVATGTGISPIKCILESLMDDPDCPPVSLYWGMREERDLYLDERIRTWAQRLYEFRYVPVVSRPGPGWTGRRGRVQAAVAEDHADLSEHSIYLCGSPAMIGEAKQAFLERGASVDHVYVDGFSFQSRAGQPA